MSHSTAEFEPIADKMRAEGLPDVCIRTFEHYYQKLREGATGLLGSADIEPVERVPNQAGIQGREADGERHLGKTVLIKLNGGLGTSMGMTQAKSLLPVRDGLSFLDVIARQVLYLRQAHQVELPLLLMNSFRTQEDSLAALQRYPELAKQESLDFLQHKVPRLRADDLSPVDWPQDPGAEWCPPGHGDIYTALQTSGTLQRLLAQGYEYAFLSNADNLGAVLDLSILGWFASGSAPFVMEVAARTEADKKGGHLARLNNGRLTLRESAQCPPEETGDFQNVSRHRFFNTNNLWLKLKSLDEILRANDGILKLPMIRNAKPVDSKAPDSPQVIQLETAMGAAISLFEGSAALEIPRSRFAPVKTTNDLLCLWSDQYRLEQDSRVLPVDESKLQRLVVDLDPQHYKHIEQFQQRFPGGAPSLIDCERFVVKGDVRFGKGVVARGNVLVKNDGKAQRAIADGTVLGSA